MWYTYLVIIVSVAAILAYLTYRGTQRSLEPAAPLGRQPGVNQFSLVEVTTRAFLTEFGAYEDAKGMPLSVSKDLRIPPGTYARFLEDLRIDHGFSISGSEADDVDTLQDLIVLLTKRHFGESSLG